MKNSNLFKLSLLAFSVLGIAGCSHAEPVTKEEQIIQENEDIVSHGVQVQCLSSGVDANDHPYQSFTYTATPSTVSASTVDVSAAFVGGGSCSSYLTISHNANTKTITATCLQPFSTLIKIHIQSHYNSSAYAEVTVHYTQKFNEGFKGTYDPENDCTMDDTFLDYLMNTWQSIGSITTETPIDRSQLFNFLNQDLITQYYNDGIKDESDVISQLYDVTNISYNGGADQIHFDDYYRFMTFDYTWGDSYYNPDFTDFAFDQQHNSVLLWNVSRLVNNEIAWILENWLNPSGRYGNLDVVSVAIDNILSRWPNITLRDYNLEPWNSVSFEQFYEHLVFYFEECCNPRNETINGTTHRYYTVQIDLEQMADDNSFGYISILDYVYEFLTTGNTIQGDGESVEIELTTDLVQADLIYPYTSIWPISHYGYTSINSNESNLYF